MPTSLGSQGKQDNSKIISTSASLTMLNPLTICITTNCGKFLEMGVPDHLTYLLRNLCEGQEATVRTEHAAMENWETQQWRQDCKRSVFIPIPKKGNAKECSNYCRSAVISHASKLMLKILQARFQQYMNQTSRCISWV